MSKKIYIYDLETLDIFTATFEDRDSDEKRVFVISKTRDDRNEMIDFLNNEVSGLVGYNSINFDGQILEFIYRNPNCSAKEIRSYAQIITSGERKFPDVPEWELKQKPLDLFHALSLSTKAKMTGLKWCEFMMDLPNIEDLPSQGEGDNWEEMVLSYNYNDVYATKELYKRYPKEIEIRKFLTEREGMNLMNKTEPGLAKALFLKHLSQKMGIYKNDLKAMGTDRDIVYLNEVIFPYVEFKDKTLNSVLKYYNNTSVYKDTRDVGKEVLFDGIELGFGLGGLHGALKNKIVKSDDNFIIKTADVKSYYPNLAIKNKLSPAHIPADIFCPFYEELYNQRASIPKSNPQNYVLKILLNSSYGMTNDKFSFLRDRKVTLTICINGQLLLAMLFERVIREIKGAKLIMVNTDGFEVKIPRDSEKQFTKICEDWEKLTQLELEYDDYDLMVISDVNNYMAKNTKGKVKYKGSYEFEDIPLHKNKSFSIIPRAISEYFINNIPVEQTIYNHRNIYDFCAGVKASKTDKKGKSWYELHSVEKGELTKRKLSKTVRYYMSKKGQFLFKCYEDGSQAHVEAPFKKGKFFKPWKVTYFNKAFFPNNFQEYDIDYSYYIFHANKWINNIINDQQLTLL